jgi:hypothetical protein
MRGRKPREVYLRPEDMPVLEALVRKGKTEQRVANRRVSCSLWPPAVAPLR